MTWLSEIERLVQKSKDAECYGDWIRIYHALVEDAPISLDRMARVIRELVGVAKHGSTICDADLAGLYAITCDGICEGCLRQQALNNLSPDAKEVINDSTAPRST